MDFNQFIAEVALISVKRDWRFGQALFNHLLDIRPDLAEAMRGTDNDPFYAENMNNPKLVNALTFIENNWE